MIPGMSCGASVSCEGYTWYLSICVSIFLSICSGLDFAVSYVPYPSFYVSIFVQGGILQDNFEEEKAIECFNRTIQIDPEYADAHYK